MLVRFRHIHTGRLVVSKAIEYNNQKIETLGLAPFEEPEGMHDAGNGK